MTYDTYSYPQAMGAVEVFKMRARKKELPP